MCILDLSKVLMYEFRYDCIENGYGKNSRLLFTDTDSLMYEIKMENVCEDFSKDEKKFDFGYDSNESKYYNDSNKLVAGKLKNETGGVAIKNLLN